MSSEQINVDLFDQVKKLQDIKRKHEAEELRLAQRDDDFWDAVEILLKDAKLVEMKPIFVEKAKRWLDSRDNAPVTRLPGPLDGYPNTKQGD
jgi:hypothetical protein